MKIIDAKLQVVEVPLPHPFPSTWNPGNPETKLFVTIAEIITDDGIHGYGAACDSSQLLAGIWDTHIRPLVIGKEITQVEAINTGLVNASLYAYRPWCVEVAVWDALGKYANLPIYKMLGGVQDKVLAYASTGELKSVEQRIEDADRFMEEGFKMMKIRAHHDDPFEDVRIIGEITKERLDLLREADAIAREELSKAGLDRDIWQCPVVLLADVHSVGVQGDERTYGSPIVLRPVSSEDAMTADWSRVPYDVLATISTRITNECRQINRVVLDCTSKPPATIEWE